MIYKDNYFGQRAMLLIRAKYFVVLCILFYPVGATSEQYIQEDKVVVYNWSDYIAEDVLEEFTKETGIEVEYSTFDNNEIMYSRLKILRGRGYDVLVPSTYLVSRMRDEGLLQAIDFEQLKNFSNLDKNLLNRLYDKGNQFSIPYLWGSTGIGLNKELTGEAEISSWSDLWSKKWKNRLLLTDDMREVFHMALTLNGHSTNSRDPEEIRQAYERLRRLMPNVKLFSGEPKKPFLENKVDIGLMWSGEMATANQENPKYQYVFPKEGVTVWIDSFVIPSQAKNVENAHKFIDFMLRPEIAARSTMAFGYATPNIKGQRLLDINIRESPIIFPSREVIDNAEFQVDVGSANKIYQRYWEKLKGNN